MGAADQTWIVEALELLEERPDVLACSPLAGAPTADGRLRSQTLEREPHATLAFRSPELSSRVFLVDTERLAGIVPIRLFRPPPHRRILARLEGRSPWEVLEMALSSAMVTHALARVDFLGSAPGMWTVHPPYRSTPFFEELPKLVDRVESGDVPEGQRGHHDIGDSMVDWSSARRPRWRRGVDHLREIGRRSQRSRR